MNTIITCKTVAALLDIQPLSGLCVNGRKLTQNSFEEEHAKHR